MLINREYFQNETFLHFYSLLHTQSDSTEILIFDQLNHIFFSKIVISKLYVGHRSYITIMKELSGSIAAFVPI